MCQLPFCQLRGFPKRMKFMIRLNTWEHTSARFLTLLNQSLAGRPLGNSWKTCSSIAQGGKVCNCRNKDFTLPSLNLFKIIQSLLKKHPTAKVFSLARSKGKRQKNYWCHFQGWLRIGNLLKSFINSQKMGEWYLSLDTIKI